MKMLKRATVTVACISVIYIISSYLLLATPYSLRMWVDVFGKMLIVVILPLRLILWGGACLCQTVERKLGIKVLLGIVVLGVYLYWAFLGFLWILFSVQEEHRLTRNLLVVNEGAPLDEVHYVYYQPVAGILRTPGQFTVEIKAEFLEEKYNRDFVVKEDGKVYDATYAKTEIAVKQVGAELEDNYVEVMWKQCFEEAYEALGLSREYYVYQKEEGEIGWMYLKLEDEADIAALAEDASLLMQYVMAAETDFFEEHRAVLEFYQVEGEERLTGFLPFGRLSQWDKVQEDYYKYPELVEARIRDEYEDAKDDLAEKKEYEKYLEAWRVEMEKSEEIAAEKPKIAISKEESAAQLIYDADLKTQGYSYELKYNAKGNLYIDLDNEGDDHFTLVYDRTSKNGACELFVLYKEHYTLDEAGNMISESTKILDMYAVEMETGRVIASGRQAWSDVGTEEYREITGE